MRAETPDLLKLLAHDLRWKLITALAHSDRRVQELVTHVHEPPNLVSYHLKRLRQAALVHERRSAADARDIYYSLDVDHLRALYEQVGRDLHPAIGAAFTPGMALPPARVLFLCTANSARSQMAEGLLRHLSGGQIHVMSAGSAPASVHPFAIKAMASLGIDIRQQRAKHVDDCAGQSFDYVVTVCDKMREICPAYPAEVERIHWSLPDPHSYEEFERVAQALSSRVRHLLAILSYQSKSSE